MQLSKLIIEARIRTGWSAIDLGFKLAKRFWLSGFLLWLVLALPIFFLTSYIFGAESWVPFLLIWWLKPIFERPFLLMLSRELFSEKMSGIRAFFSFGSWLKLNLLSVLVTQRINFSRSMLAPIYLLEQKPLAGYSSRARVLGNRYSGAASSLTIVLLHFESFFAMSAIMLMAMMFPELYQDLKFEQDSINAISLQSQFFYLLSAAAIAPFYTAAGFIMYISRRIELEGWDIEICFRDWADDSKISTSLQPNANRAHS